MPHAASTSIEMEGGDVALGRAVELAGRLPTLANAAAMSALWAIALEKTDRSGAGEAKARFRDALDQFASVLAALKDGDEALGVDPRAAEGFAERVWSEPQRMERINAFVARGYFVHTLIAGPGATEAGEAADLARFVSGDLDAALREVIDRLGALLAERSRRRQESEAGARKLTGDMIANLKDLTLRIQLISLNASVEAARAGPAGRGFGVIAQEINALSDNAQDAVNTISRGLAQANG